MPIADLAAVGSGDLASRFDHIHPSKIRRARAQTAADGTYTWTFTNPFANGVVPIICGIAEAPNGSTDVYNLQLLAPATNLSCSILVNRTVRSVVALLGLTILSVPSSPGATFVDLFAADPS